MRHDIVVVVVIGLSTKAIVFQNWTVLKIVKLLLAVDLHFFKGYYMYIEASSPRQPGDNAKLYSPPIKFPVNMCLQFYYHMSGSAIGSLKAILNGKVVFYASGDKGDIWYAASVNVPPIAGLHRVSDILICLTSNNQTKI